MGFGPKLQSWMLYCIRMVKLLVLINDWLLGFFRSSRSLCQGDSLPPLLFIMVYEVLRKMIKKVEGDLISRFLVDDGNCRISHLQFTDDTMIFYDADEIQIGYLRCILWF